MKLPLKRSIGSKLAETEGNGPTGKARFSKGNLMLHLLALPQALSPPPRDFVFYFGLRLCSSSKIKKKLLFPLLSWVLTAFCSLQGISYRKKSGIFESLHYT